jgi:2-polyprenyl-6-methoxyphenol hydroxylase-like FAD-dependent oxidoreductase
MPTEPNDLFGEGEYVGVFPTRSQQLGVLFLASTPAKEPDLPEGRITYLRERFGNFGWIVPTLLQSLHDPAAIFSDDIDQVVLETWYRGRVVLLGDAAHAVSPTTAMGGAMALEDAHVLAEELHQVDAADVEQALARYVTRRKPRIAQLQQTSDFLVWVASIERPIVAFVRNTVIHLLPSSFLLQGMEPMLETQA